MKGWRADGHAFCNLQSFLSVYDVIKAELLEDKLFEGQPQAAKDWVKEVSRNDACKGAIVVCSRFLSFVISACMLACQQFQTRAFASCAPY